MKEVTKLMPLIYENKQWSRFELYLSLNNKVTNLYDNLDNTDRDVKLITNGKDN